MGIYYVDYQNGNDQNNGRSQGKAWKTISKVNSSTFLPGDQVLFRRGQTWRETLVPPSSGTSGHPIVFGAYGRGALPILTGSDPVPSWTAAATGFRTGRSYTLTQDQTGAYAISIRSALSANTVSANGTKVRFTLAAHSANSSTYDSVTFGPMTTGAVFDSTPTRVTFNGGSSSVTIAAGGTAVSDEINFSFDKTKRYGFHVYQATKNTKQGNSMGDIQYYTFSDQSTTLNMPVDGSVNNFVSGLTKIEVYMAAKNVWQAAVATEPKIVMVDGTTRGTQKGSVAQLTNDNDWFWEANVLYFYKATDPGTTVETGVRNSGIYIVNPRSYITFQDLNLTKFNSYPFIFAVSGTSSHITVQRCTVSYGRNSGIWFVQNHATEKTTDVLVDGCTVFENGNSGICFDLGINTITISNNVVHHNTWAAELYHSGIKLFTDQTDAQNLIIEHNESYSQYDGAGMIMWATGSGIWLDTVADGPIIRYNYCHDNPTIGIL